MCKICVPLICFIGAAIVGCGKPAMRVEGMVTLDGSPLADCNLVFVPTTMDGQVASARTDAQGRFQAAIATAGQYAVLSNRLPERYAGDVDLVAEGMRSSAANTLPARYGLVSETPLRVQVPADTPVHLALTSEN